MKLMSISESSPDGGTEALSAHYLNHEVPPVKDEDAPEEFDVALAPLCVSSLFSILATIFPVMARRCLRKHLSREDGSAIERCADCERMFSGPERRRYDFFLKSSAVMVLIANPLLTYGIGYRYVGPPLVWVFASPGVLLLLWTVITKARALRS